MNLFNVTVLKFFSCEMFNSDELINFNTFLLVWLKNIYSIQYLSSLKIKTVQICYEKPPCTPNKYNWLLYKINKKNFKRHYLQRKRRAETVTSASSEWSKWLQAGTLADAGGIGIG